MRAQERVRAAAYVRMSTEHQQYSTNNQMDVINEYAAKRSMDIVTVYSDEGKSGLNIRGRDSLGKMIEDVQSRAISFGCILVYDVSRWGRFQDADESAYYEYICRRAGISVHYCAEQFENDGSPVSTIVKGVKRAMAGEYSRELSSKVFQGACRLIQMGYKQGGTAGFGLRRMLIDQNGQHKGLLKMGEHKSLQTDRVILVRGPDDEVANVHWIYDAFVRQGRSESAIAQELNSRGVRTDFDREWTRGSVHQVLIARTVDAKLFHDFGLAVTDSVLKSCSERFA
jgi:DNA invertase Pin-like site-specific DNA recombinase